MAITKTVGTPDDQDFTTNPNVAIGEIVTYVVHVDLPAGTYNAATLTDTMDIGLAFVDCTSVVFTGISSNNPVGCDLTVSDLSPSPQGDGAQVVFDLGDLTSSDGSVEVTYRAVVLDIGTNLDSTTHLKNSAEFAWVLGSFGPRSTTVDVLEPQLYITKEADPTLIAVDTIVNFTVTIRHTDVSHTTAFDVLMSDEIPDEFDFVPLSLDCTTTAGSTNNSDAPAGGYADGPPRIITAGWSTFAIGDVGVCKFQLKANANLGSATVTNVADAEWSSLPGDYTAPNALSLYNEAATERWYDPNDPANINSYHASSDQSFNPLGGGGGRKPGGGFQIPVTGFTPGVVTELSGQPAVPYADNMAVTLEIPKMNLKMSIVGVPLIGGNWKVDWLTGVGGWLQGTAFPGLSGNSVITSHVVTRYGSDGPFARLNTLSVGDNIYIRSFGRLYIYQVKSVGNVAPDDMTVFDHAEKPVLTLLTCSKYNETTQTYDGRLVVSATLVQVNPVK
jgi:LPXTG-site transpeptidase (sortase) family protein